MNHLSSLLEIVPRTLGSAVIPESDALESNAGDPFSLGNIFYFPLNSFPSHMHRGSGPYFLVLLIQPYLRCTVKLFYTALPPAGICNPPLYTSLSPKYSTLA